MSISNDLHTSSNFFHIASHSSRSSSLAFTGHSKLVAIFGAKLCGYIDICFASSSTCEQTENKSTQETKIIKNSESYLKQISVNAKQRKTIFLNHSNTNI